MLTEYGVPALLRLHAAAARFADYLGRWVELLGVEPATPDTPSLTG